jgi:hypothetical protein
MLQLSHGNTWNQKIKCHIKTSGVCNISAS